MVENPKGKPVGLMVFFQGRTPRPVRDVIPEYWNMRQFKDHIRLRFGQEKADQFARLFCRASIHPASATIAQKVVAWLCQCCNKWTNRNMCQRHPLLQPICIFEHEFLISFTLLDVNMADPGGGGGVGNERPLGFYFCLAVRRPRPLFWFKGRLNVIFVHRKLKN